jgi:hypothetical protein
MTKFGVHTTRIINRSQQWFPMKPLHAVLKARFKDRPAGHYAWSQRGVSYILSTRGSTEPSEKCYMSYFEDDYRTVGSKEGSHPKLAHLIYDYLPLLDKHNKQRQKILGLERRWPTMNCWFRLLTTLIGMSSVDMRRLYCNVNHSTYSEVDILEFSDYV